MLCFILKIHLIYVILYSLYCITDNKSMTGKLPSTNAYNYKADLELSSCSSSHNYITCTSNFTLSVFLFISHLSANFLSCLVSLPVPFPNHSFPVFSLRLLRRSGRLGCFPVERRVPAVYLSISLVNFSDNTSNNTWGLS